MTMTLIDTNGRLISKINHMGLGLIVINNGIIRYKITELTLGWPYTHIWYNWNEQ